MSTTTASTGTAVPLTPARSVAVPPGTGPAPVPLAVLLAEAGTRLEELGAGSAASPRVVARLTAHLLDAAHEAGADRPAFVPAEDCAPTLSLRALGRLAARTAGSELPVAADRAARIRALLGDLAA